MRKVNILLFLLIFYFGCFGPGMFQSTGREEITYAGSSEDEVWGAAISALSWPERGFNIVFSDKEGGLLRAEKIGTAFGAMTDVLAGGRDNRDEKTIVTIQMMKRDGAVAVVCTVDKAATEDIGAPTWVREFLVRIAWYLGKG